MIAASLGALAHAIPRLRNGDDPFVPRAENATPAVGIAALPPVLIAAVLPKIHRCQCAAPHVPDPWIGDFIPFTPGNAATRLSQVANYLDLWAGMRAQRAYRLVPRRRAKLKGG